MITLVLNDFNKTLLEFTNYIVSYYMSSNSRLEIFGTESEKEILTKPFNEVSKKCLEYCKDRGLLNSEYI